MGDAAEPEQRQEQQMGIPIQQGFRLKDPTPQQAVVSVPRDPEPTVTVEPGVWAWSSPFVIPLYAAIIAGGALLVNGYLNRKQQRPYFQAPWEDTKSE